MRCGGECSIQVRGTSSARCRPGPNARRYLPLVRAMGFAAVEVPSTNTRTSSPRATLRSELRDAGLDIGAVRGGGALAHPLSGERARAAAGVRHPVRRLDGRQHRQHGHGQSADPSRRARCWPPGRAGLAGRQPHRLRTGLRQNRRALAAGRRSSRPIVGVKISIEVHQGSIADNSTATLHLLDLVGPAA